MRYVIKNTTDKPLPVGPITMDPGQQLDANILTPEIIAARDAGGLSITDATLTPAERRADVEAIKPFKSGDPAIDGE